jgi:hypothetical protein
MDRHLIVVSDVIEPEVEHVLSAGLSAFNDQMTGINDRHSLAVTVRDPDTHQVLGGITGRTSLGLLFLDLFYLPEVPARLRAWVSTAQRVRGRRPSSRLPLGGALYP